jgi:transcriptional regulator with XRE-family HTH domain
MPLQTFAKNLKMTRERLGYTQQQVADALKEVTIGQYQHWEAGRTWPRFHQQLLDLCDFLKVKSIDDFVRKDLSKKKPRGLSAKKLSI